jgi:hypothetical protein
MSRTDVAVAAGSAPDSTFRTDKRAGAALAGAGGRGMATTAKEANLLQ